jgi:hypothetical protein
LGMRSSVLPPGSGLPGHTRRLPSRATAAESGAATPQSTGVLPAGQAVEDDRRVQGDGHARIEAANTRSVSAWSATPSQGGWAGTSCTPSPTAPWPAPGPAPSPLSEPPGSPEPGTLPRPFHRCPPGPSLSGGGSTPAGGSWSTCSRSSSAPAHRETCHRRHRGHLLPDPARRGRTRHQNRRDATPITRLYVRGKNTLGFPS